MPEGWFYVIHSVVRPFAVSCVRNSSYSFHRNWIYLKFVTKVSSRFGIRSFLHPVSSTLFGHFDPYFGQFDPQIFIFCNKWLFRPRSFSPSRILSKKKNLCSCLHSIVANDWVPLWQISNRSNSDGNCRRSCAHKKLQTDGRPGVQYEVIRAFGHLKRMPATLVHLFCNKLK